MSTRKKVITGVTFLILAIPFICLCFLYNGEIAIYSNWHVKAWQYTDDKGQKCLLYEGNRYYRLKDVAQKYIDADMLTEVQHWDRWEYEHPYIYFDNDLNTEKMYSRTSLIYSNLFSAKRVCTFCNDPQKNLLYEPNSTFVGSVYGDLYIKENFVFPTLDNAAVKSIFVYYSAEMIPLEKENYTEVIRCIQEHTDFTQYIPAPYRQNWNGLYIQYENSPLYECIAMQDFEKGAISWESGGTP